MTTDLADRVQRVRLLLDTLNDPYPVPGVALRPESGPAPSAYVPCETCRRQGEVRVRGGFQLCLLCDGRGWRRRENDEEPWDAYVELPLAQANELPVPIAPKSEPPPGVEESYAWERDRARYDRHGSYAELRTQLSRLSLVRRRRYWLVRSVLVEHEPIQLDRRGYVEIDLGVVQLALWMRSVKVPGWLIERTRASENAETLAELASIGLSAGEIARALGLPKEAVVRKLKRRAVRSSRAGIPATAM
jgi:hypothetical protein